MKSGNSGASETLRCEMKRLPEKAVRIAVRQSPDKSHIQKKMTAKKAVIFSGGTEKCRAYVSVGIRQPQPESFVCDQPSEIAPVGHAPAQEPQEMQVSGSITYCPSP